MADQISFFPKFAPASGEIRNTAAELVNINEMFADQFFSGDLDTLDFLKDLSDTKAFDMDELMDLGRYLFGVLSLCEMYSRG
jgi:hypothetical protein